MKTVLILGISGFIGSHLGERLKKQGCCVIGCDRKLPEFYTKEEICSEFYLGDLTNESFLLQVLKQHNYDELYQLAAEMGGAGYVFTGKYDADIATDSALINLLVAKYCPVETKLFFSSSVCLYPRQNLQERETAIITEDSAIPANPDSVYGWEKLFSEIVYLAHARNRGLRVKIARFHNTYGPKCTYGGGREKFPAAICRKVALADKEVEIWGSGYQVRPFLYVDDLLDGIQLLMNSEDFNGPVNFGPSDTNTILKLTEMTLKIGGKEGLSIKTVKGPVGVNYRPGGFDLAKNKLGWEPKVSLQEGFTKTYNWVKEQLTD